ncbi:hypothetical protein [Pseudomonas abietaniphila]|uniref:hypothetical protein n=1 Tax=Pseudomonas abietaniphila TaxID=89065 RepID=UPI000782732A|nr:hypothetical protein [Pseudomonas abietaniphila]
MSDQTYPFVGWVLGGTFIPKQVEFISRRCWYGQDWHESKHGKDYRFEDVFSTKEQAIAHGNEKLKAMELRLAKQQTSIAKKRKNLAKATA